MTGDRTLRSGGRLNIFFCYVSLAHCAIYIFVAGNIACTFINVSLAIKCPKGPGGGGFAPDTKWGGCSAPPDFLAGGEGSRSPLPKTASHSPVSVQSLALGWPKRSPTVFLEKSNTAAGLFTVGANGNCQDGRPKCSKAAFPYIEHCLRTLDIVI